MDLKDILTYMGLIGIPSIFAMTTWCIRSCKKYTKQLHILMKAQQAQMRKQLLEDYHKYMNQGWISEDDLLEWENQYISYHELGENGVLTARREQLLALPNFQP